MIEFQDLLDAYGQERPNGMHVSFEWNDLYVSANVHMGTTPEAGPDPSDVEDVTLFLDDGGTDLPDWLTELVMAKHGAEILDKCLDEAAEPD